MEDDFNNKAPIYLYLTNFYKKHKTQRQTNHSPEKTKKYILDKWKSSDFLADDLISEIFNDNNNNFECSEFIFFKKFLEKRKLRIIISKLLSNKSIQLNAIYFNTFLLDFDIFSEFNYITISNAI